VHADITIADVDYRVEGPDLFSHADLEQALEGYGCAPLSTLPLRGLRHGDRLDADQHPDLEAAPQLIVAGGMDAGTRLALRPGVSTIGRDATCDHRLRDPEVSRIHLTVEAASRQVVIRELATRNRATVNGRPLDGPHRLRPGDRLRVGTTVLQLAAQAAAPPAPDRTSFALPGPPPRTRGTATALAGIAPLVVTGAALAIVGTSRMMVLALASSLALSIAMLLGRNQSGGRRERRAYRQRVAEVEAAIDAASSAEEQRRRWSDPPPDLASLAARVKNTARTGAAIRLGLGSADASFAVVGDSGTVSHPRLHDVPVSMQFPSGGIALRAPSVLARGQARWVLLQLVTTRSPLETGLLLHLDEDSEAEWRWTRWLPHLVEVRVDGERRIEPRRSTRNTIVLRDSSRPLEVLPNSVVISIGPAELEARATIADDTGLRQILRHGSDEVRFDADTVTVDFAESVARGIASGSDNADAASPHVLELHDLPPRPSSTDLAARWRQCGTDVSAPLGVGPRGVISFDLDRDGPHALIGGTTGSGKSQLLQTFVVGLALRYPPEVVQFLLVDYKGGAAFGQCGALPHTAGVLTDLDARLTVRALRSLSAEIRRREKLLAAAGVSTIQEHGAVSGHEPLPRLVVIVDEFATLAAELPDFVTGLVGVAQRGRSLGMHLVLATQRPGGSVSPDIRANSNLRIALRTITAAESVDLIDSPAAASLDAVRPGQAVRADATSEPFQVAHFDGSAIRDRPRVTPLNAWRTPVATGPGTDRAARLDEIVAAVRDTASGWPHTAPAPPWLEPLPDCVRDLPTRGREVSIGLVDLPDEQRRDVARLDLAAGSTIAIAGGPRSGRTNTLLSIARAACEVFGPTELHLHALDYAGGGLRPLDELPHLGTLASATHSVAVTAALIARLAGQSADRGHATLLLIDGWAALCQALDAHDLGVSTSRLRELLSRAGHAQMTTVICGDRAVLAPQLATVVTERFVLRSTDLADYSLAGIAARDVPRHQPSGRALRASDAAEIQFLDRGAAELTGVARDPRAIRVRDLPTHLDPRLIPVNSGRAHLGLGGDGADPLWLRLDGPIQLLVAGPPRSGKTTLLCTVLRQLGSDPILVCAQPGSSLHRLATDLGHRVLGSGIEESIPDRAWLIIDDAEDLADHPFSHALEAHARAADRRTIVAGSADHLATAFRGPAGAAKRWRSGILLQPRLADGDLVGARLTRGDLGGGPGRGIAVAAPSWGWPAGSSRDGRTPIQTYAPPAL